MPRIKNPTVQTSYLESKTALKKLKHLAIYKDISFSALLRLIHREYLHKQEALFAPTTGESTTQTIARDIPSELIQTNPETGEQFVSLRNLEKEAATSALNKKLKRGEEFKDAKTVSEQMKIAVELGKKELAGELEDDQTF